MSVPAPTPYKVAKYSTDSAGEAFGTPIIELLHDYYHHDADDYQANEAYATSLIGVFASIMVFGILSCLIVWCFNCFACCQCTRNCCSCFFIPFNGRRFKGKLFTIGIFLSASVLATSSYFGRNEFNDAVFEIGDQMRYVADIFDDIATEAASISSQGATFVDASNSLVCANQSATTSFQATSESMVDTGDSLEGLVNGVADEIRDAADYIEEEFPPRVDLAIGVVVGLIWLNTLIGGFAVMTEELKVDDWLAVIIGTITILVLSVVVAAELTLATFAADFCYAVPEQMMMDEMKSDSVGTFYLTCNGTSPFASHFDSARSSVDDFFIDIAAFGSGCNSDSIQTIASTSNDTLATLDSFESITSCGRINPVYTNTMHGIFCDEFVRGLFILFMVQGFAAVFLFLGMMVMPCAANAKPMFHNPRDMAQSIKKGVKKQLSFKNKVAPEETESAPSSSSPISNEHEEVEEKMTIATPIIQHNEIELGGGGGTQESSQLQQSSSISPPPPTAPEETTSSPITLDAVVVSKEAKPSPPPIVDEKSIDDEEIANAVSF